LSWFGFLILFAAAWRATQRLLAVSDVINQAIGDALSVLLLVEVILQYLGWSMEEWDSVYQDLPSRQLKVNYL
jgi:phosphoacetylglucosamine mutase